MTYQKEKLKELTEILMVKGRNKPGFCKIKAEMISKLGPVTWERLFRRAQVRAVIRSEHGED